MNSCCAAGKVLVLPAAQSATELFFVLLGEAQASPLPKSSLY